MSKKNGYVITCMGDKEIVHHIPALVFDVLVHPAQQALARLDMPPEAPYVGFDDG